MALQNKQRNQQYSQQYNQQQDDKLLGAYLNGELKDQQKAQFQQRLLQEPALNYEYQQLKLIDRPPQANISTSTKTTTIPKTTSETSNPRYWVIATMTAIISIVGLMNYQSGPPNAASHELNQALYNQPSMQPTTLSKSLVFEEKQFIVLMSFRHVGGQLCREFKTKTSTSQTHAVGCKYQQQWQIMVSHESKISNDNNAYTNTFGATSGKIEKYLKQALDSVPLSELSESRLIANDWQ